MGKRVKEFLIRNPKAELIHLSIGDTSEPLPPFICAGLSEKAREMSTPEGYRGYGPEQGESQLRALIAKEFYQGAIEAEEVFISDGAKCDLARLLTLFGPGRTIAVQNPTYPAFVDAAMLFGCHPVFLSCTPENGFFPELESIPSFDLLYFCSPNNPTGAVATRSQLEKLVAFVKSRGAILLFDSAYACFIEDSSLPRSIFDIPGAKEVAIETSSFSKLAGFTGVRLGWTIVPKALCYRDGSPIRPDWNRVVTTIFNGASIISQAGGIACLSSEGKKEMQALAAFYRENAKYLHQSLARCGYEVYGGTHAPYLWVRVGKHPSWALFQQFLEEKEIVTTPGSGFGSQGEGFLRFSAFGGRSKILQAIERLA